MPDGAGTGASVSNLAGIVVTPLFVALLLSSRGGGFSLDALRDVGMQLLLPFALGQLARPLIGKWLLAHKQITSIDQSGSDPVDRPRGGVQQAWWRASGRN